MNEDFTIKVPIDALQPYINALKAGERVQHGRILAYVVKIVRPRAVDGIQDFEVVLRPTGGRKTHS